MDNVIELTLSGTPNQMMFLYNDVLYVVNNANSLADACHAISKNEGIRPDLYAPFENVLLANQRKRSKYTWLKRQGYRRISSSSLTELDELIVRHFGLSV